MRYMGQNLGPWRKAGDACPSPVCCTVPSEQHPCAFLLIIIKSTSTWSFIILQTTSVRVILWRKLPRPPPDKDVSLQTLPNKDPEYGWAGCGGARARLWPITSHNLSQPPAVSISTKPPQRSQKSRCPEQWACYIAGQMSRSDPYS